jgi:hypothetical protein
LSRSARPFFVSARKTKDSMLHSAMSAAAVCALPLALAWTANQGGEHFAETFALNLRKCLAHSPRLPRWHHTRRQRLPLLQRRIRYL